MTRLLLPALLLSLAACEGPQGPPGPAGAQGPAGEDGDDGTPGTDGDPGQDGTDGQDADCFGRDPVELTGLDGADQVLVGMNPIDVTIQRTGTETLTYEFAGTGIDYTFTDDTFQAVATDANPSRQVLVATDGCTVDTIAWTPVTAPDQFTLDVVHLVPGAGVVDFGLKGRDPIGSLDFEDRGRFVLPSGDWEFDVSQGGTVLLTSPLTTYEAGSHHVVFVYPDAAAPTLLPVEVDASPVADPESDVRVTGVHAADTVGQVDVFDAFTDTLLFEDLDRGSSEELGEVAADDYGLAIDLDNDGETDLDLGRLLGSAVTGDSVVATAYVDGFGNGKVYTIALNSDAEIITSTNLVLQEMPGERVSSSSGRVRRSVEVAGCPLVDDVDVDIELTHAFAPDLTIDLVNPAGEFVFLWDEDDPSGDDIVGTFDADAGDDGLDRGDDALFTVPELADFEGLSGNGTWTLIINDPYTGDEGTLDSWALTVGCPL